MNRVNGVDVFDKGIVLSTKKDYLGSCYVTIAKKIKDTSKLYYSIYELYKNIYDENIEPTKENIERNFGMPNPESYRKAIRFMKQAEKFGRPIITFIDTKGAYPGVGAEERGARASYCRINI